MRGEGGLLSVLFSMKGLKKGGGGGGEGGIRKCSLSFAPGH